MARVDRKKTRLKLQEVNPDTTMAEGLQSGQNIALENASHSIKKRSFAVFNGEVIEKLPEDLYIPPEALEIYLDAFEGPLDLLLYLIKRNNMNILDICVSEITHQYMAYVEVLQSSRFDLAADYLVMAATLMEIKSRILLPRQPDENEEEEDPRANLIRRLIEYERFKEAALKLDQMMRIGRDIFTVQVALPQMDKVQQHPDVTLQEILQAFSHVLSKADLFTDHHIQRETLSIRERMSKILDVLQPGHFVPFVTLLSQNEGKSGVVVTFIAVIQLVKEMLIEIVQTEEFGAIHVKTKRETDDCEDEKNITMEHSVI